MERGNGESDNGKPGNDKRDNGKRGWQTAEWIFVASIMKLIPERHDTHEHHDGAFLGAYQYNICTISLSTLPTSELCWAMTATGFCGSWINAKASWLPEVVVFSRACRSPGRHQVPNLPSVVFSSRKEQGIICLDQGGQSARPERIEFWDRLRSPPSPPAFASEAVSCGRDHRAYQFATAGRRSLVRTSLIAACLPASPSSLLAPRSKEGTEGCCWR